MSAKYRIASLLLSVPSVFAVAQNNNESGNQNIGNEIPEVNNSGNLLNNSNQSGNNLGNSQSVTNQTANPNVSNTANGNQNPENINSSGNGANNNAKNAQNNNATNANVINTATPLNEETSEDPVLNETLAPANPISDNLAPNPINASNTFSPTNNTAVNSSEIKNSAQTESQSPPPPPSPSIAPAPSGPAEMRFRFDQNGFPSVHSFLLKWNNRAENLNSIEVIDSDSQKPLQSIPLPQDGSMRLIYNEISKEKGSTIDTILSFIDYNFDHYSDLRLLKKSPYKVGEKSYLIWLFDDKHNQYLLNDALSALHAPYPAVKTKRIESVTLGAWGGGEYEKRWYSITQKGNLRVQAVSTQRIKNEKRLIFEREVRYRIKGELQRICRMIVPSEGSIRLVWGSASRCRYYMEKHPVKF